MSGFRYRGVEVVVDTTHAAELQIKGYQISRTVVDAIGRSVSDVTFSEYDKVVGDVRIRDVNGYDVAFTVGREGAQVVVTIIAVMPHEPDGSMAAIIETLGVAAILRGASGL